jgi:hypothetical protein
MRSRSLTSSFKLKLSTEQRSTRARFNAQLSSPLKPVDVQRTAHTALNQLTTKLALSVTLFSPSMLFDQRPSKLKSKARPDSAWALHGER